MLDKVGEIVSESITLPFKLTIQGVKWICSGIKDIAEGIEENPGSANRPGTDKE